MKAWFRERFWALADPWLLRCRLRLRHLEETRREDAIDPKWTRHCICDATVRFCDGARVWNAGRRENIRVGRFTTVWGDLVTLVPGAQVTIGHHCYIGEGTRVWAQGAVQIGSHVLIAHGVDIHDTNTHSTSAMVRRLDPINEQELRVSRDWKMIPSAPVVIEDDVWIGFRASILKGVKIGRGAIVAAGSIVTRDVGPWTVVAGRPATVVRSLPPEE